MPLELGAEAGVRRGYEMSCHDLFLRQRSKHLSVRGRATRATVGQANARVSQFPSRASVPWRYTNRIGVFQAGEVGAPDKSATIAMERRSVR